MTSTLLTRVAARVYGRALRAAGSATLQSRRAELERTFADVCETTLERDGVLACSWRATREIGDVVATGVRARLGRPVRITGGSAQPPRRRRARGIGTDVRHALRAIAARRADALLSIGLLALGLTASSVVFGVADSVLLHPVPFPRADRLAQIWSVQPNSSLQTPSVPRDLAARWLERRDLFASGGIAIGTPALVSSPGDPALLQGAYLSPGLLESLGVRPILGRTFAPGEGESDSDRVVLISDELWGQRFGHDPAVIGKRLRLNESDYAVVGVMPADFRYPYSKERLWLPVSLTAPLPALNNRFAFVVARLQPGVMLPQAASAVEAAGPAMAAQASRPWRYGATAKALGGVFIDDTTRRSVWVLFGATILILLLVCLNVANITMSQVFARARDAAIRSALGASRWRLVRQTLVEQGIVGVGALAVALPLTAAGLRLVQVALPEGFTFSSLSVIDLDARVIVVMTVLAIATPLLAGLAPALAGSTASVLDVLRLDTRSTTGTRGARWFRQGLIVAEAAASIVLLVSAALLARSFTRMQQADVGFEPHQLVSINIGFPTATFGSGAARDLYIDRAVAALAHLPGVRQVTPASGVPPIDGFISFGSIQVEGQAQEHKDVIFSGYDVRPAFFDVVGVPLRSGRIFSEEDGSDRAIASETLAARLWPGQTAVGRRFRWTDGDQRWIEVVGVVGDVRESMESARKTPQIYSPLERQSAKAAAIASGPIAGYVRLAVRTDDRGPAFENIRRVLRELDSTILVSAVESVDTELARNLDRPRFLVRLMLVFAAAGLVLAAAGAYGVLACLVAQRTREIGVRLMLGADPGRVARGVVIGGLTAVGIGAIIGLAAAAMLGRVLSTLLFSIDAFDPVSFGAAAVVLLLAALVAAWRPARRATRVDPMILLRNE